MGIVTAVVLGVFPIFVFDSVYRIKDYRREKYWKETKRILDANNNPEGGMNFNTWVRIMEERGHLRKEG